MLLNSLNSLNRFPLMVVVFFLSAVPALSAAQTRIYVTNNTGADLLVREIQVGGDAVSKKAWKKGDSSVQEGETKQVLAVNRSGKVNWMDPTPRFVEPGKTTTFAVVLDSALTAGNTQPLVLQLKLLGTGESSKMWYKLKGVTSDFNWQLDTGTFDATWQVDATNLVNVTFGAYDDDGKTHVNYSLSLP